LVSTYNTPGSARSLVVIAGYVYLADYDFGLRIIDARSFLP
jgi:hypothetical protein